MVKPTTEWKELKLADLVPDPKNARVHNERSSETVNSSLGEFGQVENIVVRKANMQVIGGHSRLAEMQALGEKKGMVCIIDCTEKQATRLGLVLNRSAELSEWDENIVAELLKGLDEEEAGTAGLGFDAEEVDGLLATLLENEPPDPGGGGGGGPQPVIAYNLVFENPEQQETWFKFLRRLKTSYPDDETVAARVIQAVEWVELPGEGADAA